MRRAQAGLLRRACTMDRDGYEDWFVASQRLEGVEIRVGPIRGQLEDVPCYSAVVGNVSS